MAKKHFRKGRQEKEVKDKKKTQQTLEPYPYASSRLKIKAFLTDAFMLVMPIIYSVFYLVMDGRDGFAAHKLLGWLYILVPLIIVQTLFMYISGQTPGYRAYNMTLIDEQTKRTPTLLVIFFRNIAAILSLFTLLGWMLMFFRKDSKALHDLLSATAVVYTHDAAH